MSAAAAGTAPLTVALFDLDGTLLDTAADMTRALNRLRAEEQLPPLPVAAVRSHVSHGSNAVVRTGFPEADTSAFDALRERFLARYHEGLAIETRLFDGCGELLDRLDAHGRPWGIVTNKAGWLARPLLAALGLETRARALVFGDSLAQRKPDPLPLLTAADQIGVPPAGCLYLGDALRDAQAARAAGMIAIGARYGYIDASDAPEQWPVSAWVDSPLELLGWLDVPRAPA